MKHTRRGISAACLGACTVVALLVLSAAAVHAAAAAGLPVTAAPIQTWKSTDLPAPDQPMVDLGFCGELGAYDAVLYGTPGADVITAGNGRQIIVGLSGDDVLSGGNHDDCLVGGDGDDRLRGGNGRDLLFGQDGADDLDGGTGKDVLDAGGEPGDSCLSEGAPDVMVGCGEPSGPAAPATDVGSWGVAPPKHSGP